MRKALIFLSLALFFGAAAETAFSQTAADGRSSATQTDPQDDFARDLIKKQRIKAEIKAFQDILDRCDENNKLTAELKESFGRSQKFSSEDAQKLERISKNSRKILDWLDAEVSSETSAETPKNTADVLVKMSEITQVLREKMTKNTRFSVSLNVIEEVRSLLKLTETARQGGLK